MFIQTLLFVTLVRSQLLLVVLFVGYPIYKSQVLEKFPVFQFNINIFYDDVNKIKKYNVMLHIYFLLLSLFVPIIINSLLLP